MQCDAWYVCGSVTCLCARLQQHDFVIYDYTGKMSFYDHHTYYEDGTEYSFKLLAHFESVSNAAANARADDVFT